MPTNKSFLPVPPALIESTLRKLIEIKEEWRPFFVQLDAAEREGMPKMGDKSLPFAQKARELVRSQPQYVPPFANAADFETDMSNVEGVTPVYRELMQLVTGIADLLLVSNSEAYAIALAIYAQVKMASERLDNPEARAIAADLGKRYPGRRRKAPEAEA